MIGGSSVSYLALTPSVPLFCSSFDRGGNKRVFRLPGEGGDHSIARWNLCPVIIGAENTGHRPKAPKFSGSACPYENADTKLI